LASLKLGIGRSIQTDFSTRQNPREKILTRLYIYNKTSVHPKPCYQGQNMFDRMLTPSWCRIEDSKPQISLPLNIVFAFCAGFSSACLYYSHPILDVMAKDFGTDQTSIANIPTLAQAGEATCLLLIMPLADYVPRRKFTLVMAVIAALFWYVRSAGSADCD
jgi:hypothetical protein